MKLSRTFIALILFSFGVGALQAQTPTTPSQAQDCGHIVQQFYDWYAAKENALMKRNSLESALEVTLREKRSSFSPELVKGIKEDLAASKKSRDPKYFIIGSGGLEARRSTTQVPLKLAKPNTGEIDNSATVAATNGKRISRKKWGGSFLAYRGIGLVQPETKHNPRFCYRP